MVKYVRFIQDQDPDWAINFLTHNKVYKVVKIGYSEMYDNVIYYIKKDNGKISYLHEFCFILLSPLEEQLYLAKERIETKTI